MSPLRRMPGVSKEEKEMQTSVWIVFPEFLDVEHTPQDFFAFSRREQAVAFRAKRDRDKNQPNRLWHIVRLPTDRWGHGREWNPKYDSSECEYVYL